MLKKIILYYLYLDISNSNIIFGKISNLNSIQLIIKIY